MPALPSQRLKNAAARGITSAWDTLAEVVTRDTQAYLEVLPLIYTNLDAQKVPQPSMDRTRTEPSKAMRLARHGLDCLWKGFEHPEPKEVPRIGRSIERHWQDIWAWCEFFSRHFVYSDDPEDLEEDVEYYFYTSGFMSNLFYTLACQKSERTRALLKATAGFPKIIAFMWLHAYGYEHEEIPVTVEVLESLLIFKQGEDTVNDQNLACRIIDTLAKESHRFL